MFQAQPKMEGEEEEDVSEGSREWEPINYPHRHQHQHLQSSQTHHRSLSDSQTQFRGWSMVAMRDSHFDDHDAGDRSFIFPPINHEGLHVSSTPYSSLSSHYDQQEHHKSSDSPCVENGSVSPPRIGSAGGGEVARWVSLGFELLRCKVSSIASSIRDLAALGGTNWSFGSATGVAAVLVVWWWYMAFRRRRRRLQVRKESRDHLILLIKERDEKINQLLHQIAQMNQVLLSLHRESSSGTGGLTK